MNGLHDVGGMHGFGRVVRDPDEPVFGEPWERDAFAVMLAAMSQGLSTVDENRFAMEDRDPAEYLATPYFEHWLYSMEKLLVKNGVITEDERLGRLRAVRQAPERFGDRGSPRPPDEVARRILDALEQGGPTTRNLETSPRHRVGDAVRTREMNPAGHTRMPRYVRNKPGVVVAYHGAHVFPDTNAHGRGECPQHLYTVRFETTELWGADRRGEFVHVDLWESYLTESEVATSQGIETT